MNRALLVVFTFILTLNYLPSFSQSAYAPLGSDTYYIMDRMEIKSGRLLNSIHTSNKPYIREDVIKSIRETDTIRFRKKWNKVDSANINWLKIDNSEWAKDKITLSKKPFLKYFYVSKANLFSYDDGEFMVKVNPVLALGFGGEQNPADKAKFINSRGVELRGSISKKLGFYFYVTENQVKPPVFVQEYINRNGAFPQSGYFKFFKPTATATGYDFFNTRGYFNFKVFKHITITFGVDNNFIGNGDRSLLLSNFSNDYMFLKLATRLWKFEYTNLFIQGIERYAPQGPDRLLPKRFGSFHHLSLNVTKWLNMGLFEGIIFSRTNGYELSYLNPIIFYRSIEQNNGSPDNAVMGLDFKANFLKCLQVYGQFLLDDLNVKQFQQNNGYWGNKYALQGGVKYIDALTVKNLDIQLEVNWVRPYTYSHSDTVSSYTNYNLPLAHPLGANFKEVLGIIRYQPIGNLLITAKAFYIIQGLDMNNANYGSDIKKVTTPKTIPSEVGNFVGQGRQLKVQMGTLTVTYQLRHNVSFDADLILRRVRDVTTGAPVPSTKYAMLTFRWNIPHRNYDF